jgi:hypothetical protein
LAIVNRWRARQAVAVRAGPVAPAIRTRRALTDCAFAIALKTQRCHTLANRGEIVGGAGCVWRHVGPMITLVRQIDVQDSSPDQVSATLCSRHARRRLLNR